MNLLKYYKFVIKEYYSTFTEKAWSDYLSWQNQDKKTLKKINTLLMDIQRNGSDSRLGKAEILKNRKGYSKRIDNKNHIIYDFNVNGDVIVISCKGHYEE